MYRISQIHNQLHDNAMTGVHVCDIHSNPIVFHYSVGSDIAYLQLVGNARASVHGISKTVYTRASFLCVLTVTLGAKRRVCV